MNGWLSLHDDDKRSPRGIDPLERVHLEPVQWYGETRYRFWVKAFWYSGRVSDGGMYRTRKEAYAAGSEFIGKANGKVNGKQEGTHNEIH